MPMPDFVVKFLRSRARDRVLTDGRRLRDLRASRPTSAALEYDINWVDSEIDRLERRVQRALDYLKKTA